MTLSKRSFWLIGIALVLIFVAVAVKDHFAKQARADAHREALARGSTDPTVDVDIAAMDCPTPFDSESALDQPLQDSARDMPKAFALKVGTATPVATFAVEGRVLGRKNYSSDRESRFAPTDIAFGWSHMRDPDILAKLHITQSSRWYHYSWVGDPPIPLREIVQSSANMHMIPANARIEGALSDIDRDDIVRVDGYLVKVADNEGWAWQSSMTRQDSGAGACEVVYVCRLRVTSN